MKRLIWLVMALVEVLWLSACGGDLPEPAISSAGKVGETFALTSPAFASGQPIPARHTCTGADLAPELAWDVPPAGTQSLALIMDDPDAPGGTWTHWILFNLPPQTQTLSPAQAVPAGSLNGKNSWGKAGYGGPCPPFGTHHYYFKLYALDAALDPAEGATRTELLARMDGHVLAVAELMGTYAK